MLPNAHRTPRGTVHLNGLFDAKVVTVTSTSEVTIHLIHVNPDLLYRARIAEGIWTAGLMTKPAHISGGGHPQFSGDGVHDHGEHSHRLGIDLAAGDLVIVAFVHGRTDHPFVLAKLPKGS